MDILSLILETIIISILTPIGAIFHILNSLPIIRRWI